MDSTQVPRPEYRQARFSDLEAIAAIEDEVFDEPYRYLMLRQLYDLHGSDWLVAELDGNVIGYALTLEKARRALLFTFAVAKRFQSRGYGRALLEHTLERSRAIGAEVEYLTVRPDNLPASNLFKQAGFVFVAHDERYFGAGEPRDLYEYHLHG
ncbi:GNAT family N-acetyltransferase [Nocardia pseudobrasiliensis]|uniref:[SSU ribosomal protein S18P]-alanine acetyltransferase n=1 Tax=Nocardia pseudobrasiliensis TaxID=45979 RepID=A0A370I219_9NOCA|nr:GNAT family N-acetyltransferase [Nocardia pseudobrasiliensis]RDI64779.1 [SSU ribosomal protein S18P]-alanine acetyltransferase [Nocardia pseudobrasiliensis]